MLSRNRNKQPTATARNSFSLGLAIRGTVESEIHRFLAGQLDVEYELKTLHKGWLSSTYQLNIEYYGTDVDHFKAVIQSLNNYFNRLSSDD